MNKHIALLLGLGILLSACGGNSNDSSASTAEKETPAAPAASEKGIGEIKSVTLNDPLKPDMVATGQAIYDMKCAACHKLDDMRVVGPGWKGITERRKPEWIMNMITNVEIMLDKDPAA